VDELVVRVVAECGLQGCDGLLGVARRSDIGDPGPRVEGAAGLLGVGLGPVVPGSVGERAVVDGDRLPARGQLRVLVLSVAGCEQGTLEPPDVDMK
jgi:hypothetical protein